MPNHIANEKILWYYCVVLSYIDLRYEPDEFGYTDLLSSAKTWKSFGELEIVINTPYYISSSSIDGFTKTETGYTMKLDGLPEVELTFNLSTSENPTKPVSMYQIALIVHIAIIVGVALLIIGGIVVAVVLIVKKRRRAK